MRSRVFPAGSGEVDSLAGVAIGDAVFLDRPLRFLSADDFRLEEVDLPVRL